MALEDSRKLGRVSATETVDSGSVLGRFKPKVIKVGVAAFLLVVNIKEDLAKPTPCVVGR